MTADSRWSRGNLWKPLDLLPQHLVSAWDAFEAEGEELSLWLAELGHLTGNTCQRLQVS